MQDLNYQYGQIDEYIEANAVDPDVTKLLFLYCIWHVIRKEKERDLCQNHENFIEDLYKVIKFVFHWKYNEIVSQ